MKQLKINKKSWHYELAKIGCSPFTVEFQVSDFCSYTRKVVRGFFCALAIIALVSIVSYFMIAQPLMYAISGFDSLFLKDNDIIRIGAVLWGLVTFIVVAAVIGTWSEKRKNLKAQQEHEHPSTPGFLTIWYRTIKEKTCFKVDFE